MRPLRTRWLIFFRYAPVAAVLLLCATTGIKLREAADMPMIYSPLFFLSGMLLLLSAVAGLFSPRWLELTLDQESDASWWTARGHFFGLAFGLMFIVFGALPFQKLWI
jgi:hypothetical protein